MTINGFALACAIDESPPYFTYDDHIMLIIQSKNHAKSKIDDFQYIEPFIEALISHESIHVVIKELEGENTSDSLDDMEIIVERQKTKFQVTLNNILFANDMSGIVTP
jgi:CRISPR/Cas system CMR-associated protein Cmr5 small subunit